MSRATILRIALSVVVSGILIWGLDQLVTGGIPAAERPRLWEVMRRTTLGLIAAYVALYVVTVWLRAVRFRLLIRAAGERQPPSLLHVGLATQVRNMMVDLFPARIGELSYVAMLNRGYSVSAAACVSSLAISFVFDFIALLFIVAVIIGYQLVTSNLEGWVLRTGLVVLLIGVVLFLGLFLFLPRAVDVVGGFRVPKRLLAARDRLLDFARSVIGAIDETRRSNVLVPVALLSAGVRAGKYLGMVLLFWAIVRPNFPALSGAALPDVVTAIIAAEGAASMPLPTFMSFGTYEASGTAVLTRLGFSGAQSLVTMLAIHIWSQVVDYGLGLLAWMAFVTGTGKSRKPGVRRWVPVAATLLVLAVGGAWLALKARSTSSAAELPPPPPGHALQVSPADARSVEAFFSRHPARGGVVWSSNRSGNHDIWMMDLPERTMRPLTDHPHTEYHPRFGPSGQTVVFARAHQTWVSQRNVLPWDIYAVDLNTGKETLVAKHGTTPNWADGHSIVFLRRGRQIVSYNFTSGEEAILFESGKSALDERQPIYTPNYNPTRQALGFNFKPRVMGLVPAGWTTALYFGDGTLREVAGGCQLNWDPDGRFLYQVAKGGKQANAIYKVDAESFELTQWIDLPGTHSHEYFPRLDPSGRFMVIAASTGDHEHDRADYELFLWAVDTPPEEAVRLTFHSGNDNWPDVFME